MKNVIISDYDDTIIKGSTESFGLLCEAVLGSEELTRMINLPNNLGREWFEKYLNNNSLTKEKAEILWQSFKKTKTYQKFSDLNNKNINRILEKAESISVNNPTSFYIEEILFPLIALYNVYISKLEHESEFFKLYEEIKANNNIFILNTYKPHKVIIRELEEYYNLDPKKYKIFKEILDNNEVFGTTKESCKGDKNRIDYLLQQFELNKNDDLNIVVIGDSKSDFDNFQQAQKIKPSSQFLFINTRIKDEIKELKLKIGKLKESEEKLKELEEKIKSLKTEKATLKDKKASKSDRNYGSYEELIKNLRAQNHEKQL